MLTARQRDLLAFIETFSRQHGGVAPTFAEMADAMALRSKSGVHRLLGSLEERGFIRRLPARARAIEVVDRRASVKGAA